MCANNYVCEHVCCVNTRRSRITTWILVDPRPPAINKDRAASCRNVLNASPSGWQHLAAFLLNVLENTPPRRQGPPPFARTAPLVRLLSFVYYTLPPLSLASVVTDVNSGYTRGLFPRRPITFVYFDGRPIIFVYFDGRPITRAHSLST